MDWKPVVKKELVDTDLKLELNTKETHISTSNVSNNFRSMSQHHSRNREIDLFALESIFKEYNFNKDIVGQIMKTMNEKDVNIEGAKFLESKKRKNEELDVMVRRLKKRFI